MGRSLHGASQLLEEGLHSSKLLKSLRGRHFEGPDEQGEVNPEILRISYLTPGGGRCN
ncbi:MAG: hypothetical protein ABSE79_14425 [Terriglobia bacterium]